jgi:hypothetical protein
MPFPEPVERAHRHTRRIVCEGFERADGLFDIDAWLTDTKGVPLHMPLRGTLMPGEKQHHLGLRITVDETLEIKDVVAMMDVTPSDLCRTAEPNFKKLIGLNFNAGFNREARSVLKGTLGCTHLLDLLGPMATTAFQVVWTKNHDAQKAANPGKPPAVMNNCAGWAEDGELMYQGFPEFYKGPPLTPRTP